MRRHGRGAPALEGRAVANPGVPATVLLGGATYAVFMIAGNVAGVWTRLADALPGSLRITPRQV